MTFKEHLVIQAREAIPFFLGLALFQYLLQKWGYDPSMAITSYGAYFLAMTIVILLIAALTYGLEKSNWFPKPKKWKDLFKST